LAWGVPPIISKIACSGPGNAEEECRLAGTRQRRARIEGAGYTDVTALKKNDNGVSTGSAKKGGRMVNVKVDFQGNVTQ